MPSRTLSGAAGPDHSASLFLNRQPLQWPTDAAGIVFVERIAKRHRGLEDGHVEFRKALAVVERIDAIFAAQPVWRYAASSQGR